MKTSHVELSVPAEAAFARTVRMMAANLAVIGDMTVDDVEDARMVAEEGFVCACATAPEPCEVIIISDTILVIMREVSVPSLA